jgi:hypothetical protein
MAAITKEKLLHSAEEEVELVDGSGTVCGAPLSLARMILGGQLPSQHLQGIALSFHYDTKWLPDDEHLGTPEEREAWEDFVDFCVSAYLTRPKVTPQEVRQMNERNRIQLFRRATHQDLEAELALANASFRLRAIRGSADGDGAGARNGTKRPRGDRV